MLDRLGVDADHAENGKQAFEMFAANPDKYSAIAMDLMMPIMK